MAKLRIKGIAEIFEITERQAQEIKEIFEDENYKSFYPITVGPIATRKGDIMAIILGGEVRASDSRKTQGKIKEWDEYWLQSDKLSPQEKAERQKDIFQNWWFVYTGEFEMPDEKWQEAKKISEKYFQENHGIVCDPKIWGDILFEKIIEKKPDMFNFKKNILNLTRRQMVEYMTNAYGKDYQMRKIYGI